MNTNLTRRPPARIDSRNDGVQELLNALGDGLDELTDEQIEFAPMEQVVAELDRLGARETSSFTPAPEAGILALKKAAIGTPPVVPRNELVWKIRGAVESEGIFVLRGASGTGKSFLIRQLFADAARSWHPFRRSLLIDCSSLRMMEPARFERAALWQALGGDEVLHRRFMSQLEKEEAQAPFTAFLERRGAGTLLIVDQAEHLDSSGAMGSWLTKVLLPIAEQRKLSVIFCVRTPRSDRGLKPLRSLPYFEVRNYVREELAEWLELPFFRQRADRTLTPDRLLRLTGGCPRLVRDFSSYASVNGGYDSRTLLAFASWRPNHFISDCERFVWAARAYPDVLAEGIDILSHREGSSVRESMLHDVKNSLLATGVVTSVGEFGLRFKSPIHQKRIKLLLEGGALKLLACRARFRQLERTNDLATLRKYAEIAPDVLGECIAAESQPTIAFRRFQEIMRRWGMDARLRLRDPNNGKLWVGSEPIAKEGKDKNSETNCLLLESPSRPTDSVGDKWLANAIHDGRVGISDDGEIFVPVVGPSGGVELVVHGRLHSKQNPHEHQIAVERVVGVVRGMRRTLINACTAYWVQRHHRVEDKLLYRLDSIGPMMRWQSFVRSLADTGPAAIIVLERAPRSWFVSRFEAFNRPDKPAIERQCVEPNNSQRLDEVVEHPSGRGLVIGGREAMRLFPNLKGEDTAVYLRPVWVGNREACRLVAFIFQGAVVGRLDGHLQYKLSAIAPEVIAAAS